MRIHHFILVFIFVQFAIAIDKLRFVQVWFRHGERTPTNYLSFPTDPPVGIDKLPSRAGELTQHGISQEFELGKILREQYGNFLGDYNAGKIRVLSGEDNRTIVSGDSMLAGLYPPMKDKQVDPSINWQPIPIHTRTSLDEVSFGVINTCEGLTKSLESNPSYTGIINTVDPDILDYLRKNTGLPLIDPYQYQLVIDSLKTKHTLNTSSLPYPQWANPLIPQLTNLSTNVHKHMMTLLNDSSGGFHADLLLSNIEEQLLLTERKALLLSGHDTNIFVLGGFFGAKSLTKELCMYGAHLMIEVYEPSDATPTPENLKVKFFYSNELRSPRIEVFFPSCDAPCTLYKLQELTKGKRWSPLRWRHYCEKGIDGLEDDERLGNGILTGSLLIAVAVLVLTSIVLLYLTCSYRKQLEVLRDPEHRPLIS